MHFLTFPNTSSAPFPGAVAFLCSSACDVGGERGPAGFPGEGSSTCRRWGARSVSVMGPTSTDHALLCPELVICFVLVWFIFYVFYLGHFTRPIERTGDTHPSPDLLLIPNLQENNCTQSVRGHNIYLHRVEKGKRNQ